MGIKILRDWKIILVILLAVFSVLAIEPKLHPSGVVVKQAVMPGSKYIPIGAIITEINGMEVKDVTDYYSIERSLNNSIVYVKYKVKKFPYVYKTVEAYPFKINDTLGLTVSDVKRTNVEFGLEIVGGTEVLLRPERPLNDKEMESLLSILRQRLNVYGLKEIPVTPIKGLDGKQYIRIEFAGVSREEVERLLSQQGKFEAKIGNTTVFSGTDIVGICLSGPPQCTRTINRIVTSSGQELWQYSLQIDISQKAAERFANVTAGLSEVCRGQQCYLNETLDFYIDGKPVEGGSLNIVSNLKGKIVTSAVITGTRATQIEAESELKRMQAILQSGSLPVSLEVEKMNTVSPLLGKEFAKNVFMVFILAIVFVDVVMLIRYRSIKIFLPMVLIALLEIVATLGIACIIHWTMDLPSIAGLLAAVGTGLDDQIVIVDELLRGRSKEEETSIKNRIKRAFFIVVAAFVSSIAAMIPLAFAGAGILRGFAITTIIAISIGVFITRPAFADIMSRIIKE